MSIERAADLMGVLLDAPVSTGFTGGLIRRVADRLRYVSTARAGKLVWFGAADNRPAKSS
jgi:hypothetical protein